MDRVAMIEAASRSLKQQLQRGSVARDRPRSNGSVHDAGTASSSGVHYPGSETRIPESAQRRNRSAENQHRIVSRDGRGGNQALDWEDDSDEDPLASSCPGLEELKRPTTRKKDPSASAASGLGALAGPARMTDAFEAKKRQPIPVESWGPRPPSRGGPSRGPSQKGTPDEKLLGQARGRGSGGASSSCSRQSGRSALEVGGTWATARAEPRVMSETRRGRERRSRGTVSESTCGDLGLFDCGVGAPQTQGLGSAFDHVAQLGPRGASWQLDEGGLTGEAVGSSPWPGSPWPGSPSESSGSSPTRQRTARHLDGVSVEDFDADLDFPPHGGYRREAAPPQVVVTRSTPAGRSRGSARRWNDQKSQTKPFDTSLDMDFLSLFAS